LFGSQGEISAKGIEINQKKGGFAGDIAAQCEVPISLGTPRILQPF